MDTATTDTIRMYDAPAAVVTVAFGRGSVLLAGMPAPIRH